ncbi:long-chain-fatty-acid--CoA ligase [Thalassospira alkalitolerans]|uniref:AMP-dependent synthetase n=1 Tax=Thalassospira alkalitolerans TaxID=1293890 RepID=A0A1Y2LFS8_9PROT|nr:long-chain fatty acid--CoA ligase [Thalassospira alkalitolerans]OSQ50031.1 AMP-dependent synthetase [Thalassospira alkalitolerans]
MNQINVQDGPVLQNGVDISSPVRMRPVHEIFDAAAERFAKRPCLDFLGRIYEYQDIAEQIDRVAEGFHQLGVRKGDKVGLCLPNTPYYVICYYAVLKCGGVVVNFNPLYAKREIAYQIEDSGCRIMVTLNLKQIYPKVAACLDETCLKRIVVCEMSDILSPVKSVLFNLFKRSELAEVPKDLRHIAFSRLTNCKPISFVTDVKVDDLAVLQYTGGTTGRPKGAMLTHGNLSANVDQLTRWMPDANPGHEVTLCVLPFFHVFAMTVALNTSINLGAELVLHPRFELDALLKTLDRKNVTIFPGVPTIYTAINNSPETLKHDLSSVRCCISGGAPLPVEVKHRFEEITGAKVVEGYGLTEASPVCTCNPVKGLNKEGSIGIPMPGSDIQIRSLDRPDQIMPVGEKGEVCVKGPQVMPGYWQNKDATDATFIDGWLKTGDVGYADEDGYTFLVDRLKDIILCSGYNVYPRAIEEAFYLHDQIAEVTVIGLPDPYRGQAPKAFVRLKDGVTGVTSEDLRAFLDDKISRIEMPREIEIREELPKTMVGKLSKKELVEEERLKREKK